MNGKCLDIPWETDLDIVHMWYQHHSANQQWLICEAEPNTYVILSRLSLKCLEVVDQLSVNRAKLQQSRYRGNPNQIWVLTRLREGCYRIHNKHSGKCLTVSNWEDRDGAEIVQWTCNGEQNQLWRIEPKTSNVGRPSRSVLPMSSASPGTPAR
ncbi:MAG: RICIN domain-containing protein [Abitibacteriaceae bacterium]|nr:RICIN domain-containing protein [Abditibacteriaceae bacterium]